jgi:hypothetical protein
VTLRARWGGLQFTARFPELDFQYWTATSTRRALFEYDLKQTLRQGGINGSIQLTDMRAGSIVVDVVVVFDEGEQVR